MLFEASLGLGVGRWGHFVPSWAHLCHSALMANEQVGNRNVSWRQVPNQWRCRLNHQTTAPVTPRSMFSELFSLVDVNYLDGNYS